MTDSQKKAVFTTNVREEQVQALKALAQATRVPIAVLAREALDDLLKKYQQEVKP